MKNLLILLLASILFIGCRQLDGVDDIPLRNNCKSLKKEIEGKLLRVNKDKGIHYVYVDTVNCMLSIRYDKSIDSLSWLHDSLEVLGYLPVADADTVLVTDSTLVVDTTGQPKAEAEVIVDTVKEVKIKPVDVEVKPKEESKLDTVKVEKTKVELGVVKQNAQEILKDTTKSDD